VVEALAGLGTREITLIGGEAYLRKDWPEIVRAIRSRGIYCAIQTGGRNFNRKRLEQAVQAGLNGLGVSLDGLAPLHDKLRGVPGSFAQAIQTLKEAREAGLHTSVNTQIGAEVMPDLPELMEQILRVGAGQWQIQLTVAMGNAADHPELLLQPYRLLELMPLLAHLHREGMNRGLVLVPGNNIGYFGPYEHLWRGLGDEEIHWSGCAAGQNVMALEADGTVKGCPSLATVGFAGGNVRDLRLAEIWNSSESIHFGRLRSVEDLWGFCRSCYYADICRAGCTWTSHSLLGRPGNNPYCHYRALELEKRGLREKIVKVRDAAATPFAVGEFALITERIADGAVLSKSNGNGALLQLENRGSSRESPPEGRIPERLRLCRSCNSYVWPREIWCPHCGADVEAAERLHVESELHRKAVILEMKRVLAEIADQPQEAVGHFPEAGS
jgi:Y-X(10)_GDL-associated radical SAM protein